MAKFLLSLLLLLGTSDALAQSCYCTYPYSDGRCYANTTCWACAPGAYATSWQQQYCVGYQPPPPVATCQASSVTEQRACPVNFSGTETWRKDTTCQTTTSNPVEGSWYKVSDTCTPLPPTCSPSTESRSEGCQTNQSGSKTYTRQSTCPDPYGQPVWSPWQITRDACVWNPPTCQASTQTQTLSCQAGYTGTIAQTKTSTCPNPYGQPLWGDWVTSSNTCVKSVTNPTNVLSPVSPISPVSPVTSVVSTPAIPAPAPVVSVPTTTQPTDTPEAPTSQSSTESAPQSQTSTETSAAPSAASSAPTPSAGSGAKAVSITQKLELIGAMPKQPSIIELISIKQELPDDVRKQQNFLLELISADDAWIDRGFPLDYIVNIYGE